METYTHTYHPCGPILKTTVITLANKRWRKRKMPNPNKKSQIIIRITFFCRLSVL